MVTLKIISAERKKGYAMFRGNSPEGHKSYSESLVGLKSQSAEIWDDGGEVDPNPRPESEKQSDEIEAKHQFFLIQIIKKLLSDRQ